MFKICPFLTSEMCDRRLQCCNQVTDLHQSLGDSLLHNIITEDETPLPLYLPEDRRFSKEFKWPGESATRKLWSGTSHRRCLMLTIFWNSCGVVHVDFADRHKVNASMPCITVSNFAKLVKRSGNHATRTCTFSTTMHQSIPPRRLQLQSVIRTSKFFLIPHIAQTWPQVTTTCSVISYNTSEGSVSRTVRTSKKT